MKKIEPSYTRCCKGGSNLNLFLVFLSVLPFKMSAIYYDSFGMAFNKWRDFTSDFRADYEESQEMSYVLRVILNFLEKKLSYHYTDPEHPFRRYADVEKTIEENYNILAADVMGAIQEIHLRGYV